MKHIKLLAIAFVSMLAMASCDTDQEGPLYTPMSENISLSQEKQSYSTDQTEIDIPVRFVRSDASKEYTAHYSLDSETAANFSDPNNGQVTFKAGEGIAIVTLKAVNMQKGVTYDATLKLSDEDVALADTITKNAVFTTAISVMCDYEWEDAGTVKFTDFIFSETEAGETGDVQVLHAKSNDVNLYKLVAPYTTLYGPASENGIDEADIKFYLNDDNSAKSLEKEGLLDLVPGSGYRFYFDTTKYPDFCYISNEGKVFEVSTLLEQDGNLYGPSSFSFVWDKWPGNK